MTGHLYRARLVLLCSFACSCPMCKRWPHKWLPNRRHPCRPPKFGLFMKIADKAGEKFPVRLAWFKTWPRNGVSWCIATAVGKLRNDSSQTNHQRQQQISRAAYPLAGLATEMRWRLSAWACCVVDQRTPLPGPSVAPMLLPNNKRLGGSFVFPRFHQWMYVLLTCFRDGRRHLQFFCYFLPFGNAALAPMVAVFRLARLSPLGLLSAALA